ncbi:MAG: hypothetical protein ACK5X3_04740 [Pseudomonadota bacterium]|jgi:hypothetical protein
MTPTLPRDLRLMREDLRACCNALDLLERAIIAGEWDMKTDADRLASASRKVERAACEAVDRIGIQPKEKLALVAQITALQDDNRKLAAALARVAQGEQAA